jgi:hypothetical protein
MYPEPEPTFDSQKKVSKHRKHISNMAVFIQKDLPDLRIYEHRHGTLDALLDADEFLFTRVSLIGALFKLVHVRGFDVDIIGSVFVEQADEITGIMTKAIGLFDGIKLQRDTKLILGKGGNGTLSARQIVGLLHQLLKSFLYCELKVVLTDDNKPKRVKKNGTKYSIYQITPLHIAGVPIDTLARSSKFASVNDSISADAAMEQAEKNRTMPKSKRKAITLNDEVDRELVSRQNKIRRSAGFESLMTQSQLVFPSDH